MKVLKGKKTGIWLKNRFYPVGENEKLMVPYASS